jgi:RNA polymerase sigma-70 factor (ECF subfamily)
MLARERKEQEPELHARLKALDACLEDLPDKDREIVRERYSAGSPIDDMAARLGISRRTLFRELDRIRRRLFECINRRLQAAM